MTWHLNNVCSSSSSSVKQTQSSYWLLCSTMSLDHLYQNYHLLCPLQSQNNLPAHLTRKWPVGNYAIKADLKAFARSALTSAFGEFTVKQLSQDCWVVNSDNRASPSMSCVDNQGFCFGWLLFRTFRARERILRFRFKDQTLLFVSLYISLLAEVKTRKSDLHGLHLLICLSGGGEYPSHEQSIDWAGPARNTVQSAFHSSMLPQQVEYTWVS